MEQFDGTESSDESEIDLQRIIAVLSRRRWTIIACTALSLVVGSILTMRMPRIYRASTKLVIESNTPTVLSGVQEVYDLGGGPGEYKQTQIDLIRSRPVLTKAVELLGLRPSLILQEIAAQRPHDPHGQPVAADVKSLRPETVSKLEVLGIDASTPLDEAAVIVGKKTPEANLLGMLKVEPKAMSQIVSIEVESPIARMCAPIANAIANAYIEFNLDKKTGFTRSAVDWLSSKTKELKYQLEQSDEALHNFKRDNNMVAVSLEDSKSMTALMLTTFNETLAQARSERINVESRAEEIARAKNNGLPLEGLEYIAANPIIAQLRVQASELQLRHAELSSRYTDEHPQMIAIRDKLDTVNKTIAKEVELVVANIEEANKTKLDNERRLQAAIEDLKQEALEVNKKEIDYNRLQRERDNNNALYDVVLKRQKETDLTQMLKMNNVHLLESAQEPETPVRPLVRVNLLASLLVGFIAGLLAAFLVDYLDSSIKSQDQIEKQLHLPFLGGIPEISSGKKAKLMNQGEMTAYVAQNPRSSVAECCRIVRTNLMFVSPEKTDKLLLVTSNGPGEGKTTTVTNLAISLAQSGTRVLIIDADMRRPSVHTRFNIANKHGLTNLIMGGMTLEEVVHKTSVEGIDVITCGPIPPNPAELLYTEGFQNVLARACKSYGRVIIDSPPISAVTDSLVLASMVDGIVFVALSGKTKIQHLRASAKRITNVGGKVYGVVLNYIDLSAGSMGSYYYYYYSGYGQEKTTTKSAS